MIKTKDIDFTEIDTHKELNELKEGKKISEIVIIALPLSIGVGIPMVLVLLIYI